MIPGAGPMAASTVVARVKPGWNQFGQIWFSLVSGIAIDFEVVSIDQRDGRSVW
jgi:hypothetical protein